MSVGASGALIERTCWACDTAFSSGSRQARVYCPDCVTAFDFLAPVEPAAPVRRVAAATSRSRDTVERADPLRGLRPSGPPWRVSLPACVDQLPMFSAKVDRRRKEWRDEG